MIARHPLFRDARLRRAPMVHSAPVGFASDSEFLNLGLSLDFPQEKMPTRPEDILDATQSIEREIAPDSPHRNADGSYRDRIVDIDIIAVDGVVMESERLTLPHPRATSRSFVMQPMAFLAPDGRWAAQPAGNGRSKKTIAEMGRDNIETFRTKKKLPLAVILDNIRSQNNVGSIFRTSDAFCVSRVALCGITGQPPSAEIHKTALGAEDAVDWKYYPDTLSALQSLREDGYTIVCLEQVHNSVSLERFVPDKKNKYAIVVGNEVHGVEQAVVDASDLCLEIPQAGTKHSLNVSVSAAIALWHFFSAFFQVNTRR